jgi:hypothetical protein
MFRGIFKGYLPGIGFFLLFPGTVFGTIKAGTSATMIDIIAPPSTGATDYTSWGEGPGMQFIPLKALIHPPVKILQ